MRHRLTLASVVGFIVAAALSAAAIADAPTRTRMPLTLTVLSPEYSAACGFDVFLSTDGIVQVSLKTNADGSVREHDVFPALRVEVSAPSTGRSFEHVFGPTTYDYPDGLYEGAPALITSVGVRGDAPGIPPDAGRVVTPGVVLAIIPGLGPITVPIGPPVSQTGNVEDPAAVIAAICDVLAG
jgi:hypothetical protein